MKNFVLIIIGMLCGCSLNKTQNELLIELVNIQYHQNYTEYVFQIQNDSKTNIPINRVSFFYNFQILDSNSIQLFPEYKKEETYSININTINKGKNKVVVKSKNLQRFKLEENNTYRIKFTVRYNKKNFYFNKELEIK